MHKQREKGTIAADAALQTRDGEEHPQNGNGSVWVLTQRLDCGTICTACFKSFDAAVEQVRREFRYHGIEDIFEKGADGALRETQTCTDGFTTYQIDECEVRG